MARQTFSLILFLLFVPLLPAQEVKDVRLAEHDEGFTRVVIEADSGINARVHNRSGHDRVVTIELNGVRSGPSTINTTGEETLIRGNRIDRAQGQQRVLLQFRTAGPVQIREMQLSGPRRLVFDFHDATETARPSASPGRRPRIIIDPGHGGSDPGAVGRLNGRAVYEKDVALAVGLKLERLLRADPRFDVGMTRRTDVRIGLVQRTQEASRQRGDLFVSIHANAVEGRAAQQRARGLEFWTWNRQANSSAAARAMEQLENRDLGVSRENNRILTSMMMDALESQALVSRRVARAMEERVKAHPRFRGHYRGINSARFRVLEIYDMPSILVELGFMTHPEEIKLLTSDSFQNTYAQVLYEGIVRYFQQADPSFPRRPDATNVAAGR